jgi:AcrR family transcriptional regulator
MPRRSAAAAEQTKRSIVDRAVSVASTDGLEGLTIGRLAGDLELSKAGVLGHFGTKEALQLAAFEEAMQIFRREVWDKVADLPPGPDRFRALAEAWISYHERDVFPGGCFLTAASTEWDDRPGPVHDRIKQTEDMWQATLTYEAKRAGIEEPEQAAFELDAAMRALNRCRRWHTDPHASARVRRVVDRMLTASG